ncbi:adhesin [Actinoplanes sp. NPDC026623]|uniref:adhesin n=1 Tax=Actinoplanes sp. NPDC026623 TaxID=3155610 RepID=UPI00340E8E27
MLGALLLGVIVLFVSCSGGDEANRRGTGSASSKAPAPVPAATTPDEEPTFTDPGPGAGNPSLPDPGELTASGAGVLPPAGTGTGTGTGEDDGDDTNVAAASGTCTDAEMAVVPVPEATAVRRGVPLEIHLKIKNISARTCTRDVGADLQELYIEQGAKKVWSSDTCSTVKGSEVRPFPPGSEREYNVTWNGKQATRCSAGLAAGTAPPAGQYEVRGRLGAKVSAPVALDVTA